MIQKIVGKGSVLRVGAGIVYDNYGSAMVEDFATSGSPGLASTVAQPANTNFATSLRHSSGPRHVRQQPRPQQIVSDT